jgi:hypothetical protein
LSVAAQVVFVAVDVAVHSRTLPGTTIRAALGGIALSGAVAVLVYTPWVPVWWKQVHDVWQGFWIPPVTWERAKEVFFVWSSGLPYQGSTDMRWWASVLLVCVVWMIWRTDRGGVFFIMQAGVPWVLSVTISAWSGRPIFYDRYLAFAQFFLFGFWSIIWDRLPGLAPRVAVAAGLCAMSLCGLWTIREECPRNPPGLATAVAFLQSQYKPGELVVMDGPSELNRLRYYATRAGLSPLQVRCIVSPFPPPGHILHLGALKPEDILWSGASPEIRAAPRVWRVSERGGGMPLAEEHWREVSRHCFGGDNDGRWFLILYEAS